MVVTCSVTPFGLPWTTSNGPVAMDNVLELSASISQILIVHVNQRNLITGTSKSLRTMDSSRATTNTLMACELNSIPGHIDCNDIKTLTLVQCVFICV